MRSRPGILVSACLLGEPVRYDGRACLCRHPVLAAWQEAGWIVPCCPELLAGLPVPRPPVERVEGRAMDRDGRDLDAVFRAGAERALAWARAQGVILAVLKEGSPSCGPAWIHDGSFQGRRVPGAGYAAQALRAAGIAVFSEDQLDEAAAWLARRVPGAPRRS